MTEPVLVKGSAAAAYGGGVVAFVGGLSANEIAAYGGLCVAAVGMAINVSVTYCFKRKHYILARERMSHPDCETCEKNDDLY